RARARHLHASRRGREHLDRAVGCRDGLGPERQGDAVRARTGQGLSAPHLLYDSRRGREPLTATPSGTELFEYLLRLGDTNLVLGHRLSEWCGHGPAPEEDLALANLALDLIGQARLLLQYAGGIEGLGRSEDDLAYLRDGRDYRNLLLVEQPNGHYGDT